MDDRVVIVAPDGNGSLAGYARALSGRLGNRTVLVNGCSGTWGLPSLGAGSLRCACADARVVRALRGLDAPLLHFTSHHLARHAPFSGTRYVVTVHDLMRHRDAVDRGGREPLIHEPNVRDSLMLRLDAAGIRRADALIAVSRHTKRELIELLGVPPERISVVPEGVDREAFRPVERRLLDDPYILYVGSEQPRKNLRTLFRAFARLTPRWPELKLVKVGGAGGPEAPFRQTTLDEARASGVLPAVVFAERVSHEDLVAWYSGALCLVQPSRHEGFGLPPLEAMACGCPPVVSSATALPEVVGHAGVVYGRPDDEEALAWALASLVSSEAERAERRRAALERAEAMSWERAARVTRAVWGAVLRQARNARPRARFARGRGRFPVPPSVRISSDPRARPAGVEPRLP